MNNATHISQDDLLLFALQFLSEDEAVRSNKHLQSCEDCRRQLGWVQGDLASYALTSDMVQPPAAARERLMRSVSREKKFVPATTQHLAYEAQPVHAAAGRVLQMTSSAPKRRSSAVTWIGWAVAAGIAVVAGIQYKQGQMVENNLTATAARLSDATEQAQRAQLVMQTLTDEGAMQVVLHVPSKDAPPPRPEAHASYLAKKGMLVFVASNMIPLEPAKTYELWVLPADKSAPIPAGTFKPDARGRVSLVLSELPKGVAAGAFGVTIEPEGGSSTPTMPIVLAGA